MTKYKFHLFQTNTLGELSKLYNGMKCQLSTILVTAWQVMKQIIMVWSNHAAKVGSFTVLNANLMPLIHYLQIGTSVTKPYKILFFYVGMIWCYKQIPRPIGMYLTS